MIRCPECGEGVEEGFDACWRCEAPVPEAWLERAPADPGLVALAEPDADAASVPAPLVPAAGPLAAFSAAWAPRALLGHAVWVSALDALRRLGAFRGSWDDLWDTVFSPAFARGFARELGLLLPAAAAMAVGVTLWRAVRAERARDARVPAGRPAP